MNDALIGLILLVAGIVVLDRGADWFTDSAIAVAGRTRVSLTVIGLLTVGIEWEELAVVVVAIVEGSPQLAFGSLMGSAIANLTIVLAAGVWFSPVTASTTNRRLALILWFGTIIQSGFVWTGDVGHSEGIALLVTFAGYLLWLGHEWRNGRGALLHAEMTDDEDDVERTGSLVLGITGGLILAIVGGELVVQGALQVVEGTGLSETVVGLTLVAIGTSVPDAAISVIAGRRDASAIVVANVAGSNLCNLLLLGGLVAVFEPISVPGHMAAFDIPVLVAMTSVFVWSMMRRSAGRPMGLALALIYVMYLAGRLTA